MLFLCSYDMLKSETDTDAASNTETGGTDDDDGLHGDIGKDDDDDDDVDDIDEVGGGTNEGGNVGAESETHLLET